MLQLALLAVPGTLAVGSTAGFIKSDGKSNFVDEHGRVRIFHGSNRVQKASPWYFSDMLDSESEFELMEKLGFSTVRIGFMWSGYNPAPGVFNQTYLDTIRTIVDKMAARGVYTLLDMHEDVFSSKFCRYDGVPLWVANKSVPKHPFPWPLKGDCSARGWMENALTEAAATAFQDLYDNTRGMLDDLSSFWAHAAQQFANVSSVIGCDKCKGPEPSDMARTHTEPSDGVHTHHYTPYARVSSRIRAQSIHG